MLLGTIYGGCAVRLCKTTSRRTAIRQAGGYSCLTEPTANICTYDLPAEHVRQTFTSHNKRLQEACSPTVVENRLRQREQVSMNW